MREPKPWWVWGDFMSILCVMGVARLVFHLALRDGDGVRAGCVWLGAVLAWLLVRTLWRRHRARHPKPVNTDWD